MINLEKVWEDFAALPQDAQQQAADFIAFLRMRYQLLSSSKTASQGDLNSESFIGIWRERTDMEDSNQWVRAVRRREWIQVDD